MPDHPLATYLNDHLAGSETALELLRHLEGGAAEHGQEVADFAGQLRREIEEDRAVLEGLMASIGIAESPLRKAAGWIGEKLASLKLRLDDPTDGALRRLEAFEAISLGIEGKRGLWVGLQSIRGTSTVVSGLDLEGLRLRAEDQRARVEEFRLAALRDRVRSGAAASRS